MGRFYRLSRLRWLFVLAVLLPCAVLAGIAVRSLNRESAYLEKRFQDTLSAEVDYVSTLLHSELNAVEQDLAEAAPAAMAPSVREALAGWKTRALLVRMPFLLSPDFEIVWPLLASANEEERDFLDSNRSFVTDRTEIPVYLSIARLFIDQITPALPPSGPPPEKSIALSKEMEAGRALGESETTAAALPVEEKDEAVPPGKVTAMAGADEESFRSRTGVPRSEAPVTADKKPAAPAPTYQQQQDAVRRLEQDESLRRKVFKQAREGGIQTRTRNVAPRAADQQAAPLQESIFISEPRRFSQIVFGRESGLIPRFRGDALSWLYWRRLPDDRILGCVVDGGSFRDRMIARVPGLMTSSRILTILDENGNPLVTPEEAGPRDWRRPSAAREISEVLPRWEVAAYPTDPKALASQARMTALLMGVLILFLFVTALAGGTVVLRVLRSEVDLARKKTSFAANVSHELKTPLTSIRMFAEMLREGRPEDPGKRRRYLDIMVSETERLTRLINNVLDFSRKGKGERPYRMERIDLVPLCEDLADSQRVRLEHDGFVVSFHHEPGVLFVRGDEEALKQAMLNLLSNAEKYSVSDRNIKLVLNRTGDSALIEVLDRGVGIPASDREKVFKDFYRVDESLTARVRGSGLGLPIALRIVRDHGGDIQYFPREGGGSVFQIRLPLEKSIPVEPS